MSYIIECIVCKKEFKAVHNTAKYCSNQCKCEDYRLRESYKKRLKNNLPKEMNCEICSKLFKPTKITNIYCSDECRKIGHDNHSPQYQAYYKLRFKIFNRDNFRCVYCGRSVIEDKIKLQVDHLIPRVKGGTNEENNLITSCSECNLGKSDLLLDERMIKKISKEVCNEQGVQSN
jgi:5-methylcytosine-specific restriction endonuclease McrA